MKLHRLTVTNFMPYKGDTKIDFPTDDTRNVMIVLGDNMRGKTSLLNALRWGFYGRAVDRHSRPIPLQELVNSDAALEDDWRVEAFIEFEASGHKYDLRRTATRRHHVAKPTRPEDFLVAVHLSRDGVPMSGEQIESEIDQIAPEQISRFFLFDGELLKEYEALLIEGSEQGRQIKDAIEQVLGVPSLIHGRAELGAILKSATKRQNSDIAHIFGLEKQAERQQELTSRQDVLERDLGNLQSRLANVRADRTKLDDEIEAAATVLASKAKLDTLLAQERSLKEFLDKKAKERLALLSQAWQDLLDIRLEVKRDLLQRRQTSLTQGLKQQGRLQTKIDDLNKLLKSKECPTCQQSLGADRRTELGTRLGVLESELSSMDDASGELQIVSAQIVALNKIRGVNARDRLSEISKDVRKAEVERQRAENEIERLNDEIAGQDTAELARKRVMQQETHKEEGRLQKDIADTRKEIERIRGGAGGRPESDRELGASASAKKHFEGFCHVGSGAHVRG